MLIIWLHTHTHKQDYSHAGQQTEPPFCWLCSSKETHSHLSSWESASAHSYSSCGVLRKSCAPSQKHQCVTLTSKKGGLAFDGFVLVSKPEPPKTNHLCYRNDIFHELFRWKTSDSQHIFATCHSWYGWNHEKEMHSLVWTFFFNLAKITLK